MEGDEPQLDTLHVLSTVCGSVAAFDVRAHVLGASHAVRITHDDRYFWEVLSCIELPYKSLASGEYPNECEVLGGTYRYHFSVRYETYERGEPKSLAELKNQASVSPHGEIGTWQAFPQGNAIYVPYTIVVVAACKGGLVIRSIHSYPNHNQVVYSTTKLTRKE